jgi:hypothetical protein
MPGVRPVARRGSIEIAFCSRKQYEHARSSGADAPRLVWGWSPFNRARPGREVMDEANESEQAKA